MERQWETGRKLSKGGKGWAGNVARVGQVGRVRHIGRDGQRLKADLRDATVTSELYYMYALDLFTFTWEQKGKPGQIVGREEVRRGRRDSVTQ